MLFLATDRTAVERRLNCPRPCIVVSIRDPGTKRPRIVKNAGLLKVLYLDFHDAEPVAGFKLPAGIRLMTNEQAMRIAQFAERYRDTVRCIVCHCEQGMSRSPAIAAAIAHSWGLAITQIVNETQPNSYVYWLVVQAMTELAQSRGHSAKPRPNELLGKFRTVELLKWNR